MLSTTIIIALVLLMLASLGSAMVYMFKDRGRSNRTVNALTWRVGIWAVLLMFIIAGLKFGFITPSNSLAKRATDKTMQTEATGSDSNETTK